MRTTKATLRWFGAYMGELTGVVVLALPVLGLLTVVMGKVAVGYLAGLSIVLPMVYVIGLAQLAGSMSLLALGMGATRRSIQRSLAVLYLTGVPVVWACCKLLVKVILWIMAYVDAERDMTVMMDILSGIAEPGPMLFIGGIMLFSATVEAQGGKLALGIIAMVLVWGATCGLGALIHFILPWQALLLQAGMAVIGLGFAAWGLHRLRDLCVK